MCALREKKTRGNKCILIGKEDKLKSYSTDQNGTGKTTGTVYTAQWFKEGCMNMNSTEEYQARTMTGRLFTTV